MQITFTAEQVGAAREIFELVLWPLAWWLAKRGIVTLRENLNNVITENVNRNRDELITHIEGLLSERDIKGMINAGVETVKKDLEFYIDSKFKEHEVNAFYRITKLEASTQELIILVNKYDFNKSN